MPYEPEETAAPRILICEDEVMLARDIERTLKQLGYKVAGRVSSGEEAVRMAEESKPDLILMDIQLGGELDGIEAAVQIRSRMDIPVVYLTGYAETDVLERAKLMVSCKHSAKLVDLLERKDTDWRQPSRSHG